MPTAISGVNLAITALAALALYSPFGVGGIVAATVIATAVSVLAQTIVLRRQLGRLELGRLTWTTVRVGVAAAALAAASYGVWYLLDQALGRSLAGQIVSLSVGLGAGAAVYAVAITTLRIPEAPADLAPAAARRYGTGADRAVSGAAHRHGGWVDSCTVWMAKSTHAAGRPPTPRHTCDLVSPDSDPQP